MDGPRRVSGGALIAALPMYDFPDVADANDALWAAIAKRLLENGIEAPRMLARVGDIEAQWRDPNLIFGQTCGYPYVAELRETVALIATPHYVFPGCEGPYHRSLLIRRCADPRRELASFRGARAAINGWTSNSGMNLFRATIAPLAGGAPFFSAIVVTGSHAASMGALAEGRADIAAIDCVSFGLVARAEPDLVARLAVAAESPPSPGLPFVASGRLAAATLDAVRAALFDVLADPAQGGARAALGLAGASVLTSADYKRVLDIERAAAAAGYPELA